MQIRGSCTATFAATTSKCKPLNWKLACAPTGNLPLLSHHT
jgi:hypothetical protein